MIRRYFAGLVVAGLLASMGSLARAQELTLHAGWVNPGNLTLENVRTGLDGSALYGARFELNLGRVIGLEQTLAYSPNFIRPKGFEPSESSSGTIYSSNVVVNLPIVRLVPYATGGLGLISSGRTFGSPFDPPGSDRKFGTRFAVNYGGGVKMIRLAGPVGLRFDARGYTVPDAFDGRLHLFEVTGGLHFIFGE